MLKKKKKQKKRSPKSFPKMGGGKRAGSRLLKEKNRFPHNAVSRFYRKKKKKEKELYIIGLTLDPVGCADSVWET